MDKIIHPDSFWEKVKASWRGFKQIRRIAELDQLDELKSQNRALSEEIKRMDELRRRAEQEWGPLDGSCSAPSDDFYYAFEETFRGSRDMIKSRLAVYLPYVERIRNVSAPGGFLDIGCGRGEWLEILNENHIPARGIDLNVHMIHEARSRGLEVEHADILDYLRRLPETSLSGISGFHVVEHLPLAVLIAMLAEIRRTLAPGGILILETPNPENLLVGSCNFYVDPTHRRPVPPPILAFIIYQAGFHEYECVRLAPPDLPLPNIENIAENALQTLAHHMTVGQDYALISFKPHSFES
ncbi:MAG: class I SAM-dependent methyltransferase [Candidatus Omnitrophota bacterium]